MRRCIACRRRAPVSELVRLALEGNRLVPGAGRPGRGAWVCAGERSCAQRALDARLLGRVLRHQPVVLEGTDWLSGEHGAGNTPGEGVRG